MTRYILRKAHLTMTQTIQPGTEIKPRTLSRSFAKLDGSFPVYSLLLFAVLSTVMAIRSDGAWLDDDLCHYQIARAVWHLPKMLLNSWGRPGCTIPYVLVAGIGSAQAGFMAARLMTVSMSVLVIWLTWQTARKMRAPCANCAPLIMLLMPEFFWESFTPCTEIPAALYSVAGVYFLSIKRRRLAAICFAILPATRHELAPFLIPIGIYFLLRRDLVAALLLGWFEAVWAALSWMCGESQPILRYFTAQDSTPYGSGNFYWYFIGWLKMSGIVVVGLCLAGTVVIVLHESRVMNKWRCLRQGRVGRRVRLRLLVVGSALGLVVLETVLYAFNRFASGGYSTFLVPAAPMMAVCACYGFALIAPHPLRGHLSRVKTAIMVVIATIAIAQVSIYFRPHVLTPHQKLIAATISDLRREHPRCHIVGDSAWITYFDEISPGARERNAIDTWTDGRSSQLYYIHDYDSGVNLTTEKIMAVPCEKVRTAHLPDSGSTIDLQIFHRLPDTAPAH